MKTVYEIVSEAVKYQVYFGGEFLTRVLPKCRHFLNQVFSKEVWGDLFNKCDRLEKGHTNHNVSSSYHILKI